jgi:hypothetical protein
MGTNNNSNLLAAALLATMPDMATDDQALSSWGADFQQKGARVQLYRKYEEGEHRSGITDQMSKMLRLTAEANGINDFNDNYCEVVVEKMAGRLHLAEITTGDAGLDKTWLSPILELNKWDSLQGLAFRGAVRDGDSYVMIDPVSLKWSCEAAFDTDTGVVSLSEQGSSTPYWAAKLWYDSVPGVDAVTVQIVVYQPDRVSYWWGEAGNNEVQPLDIVPVTIPEGLTEEDIALIPATTNVRPWPPSRVPVVHFINKASNYSSEGRSELRVVIPLQDALNRTLHSMVMASEFTAFRLKWAIGIEIDANGIVPGAVVNLVLSDENDKVITEPTEAQAAFLKAVRVGEFEATEMGQYIEQIDKFAKEVSQVSQTPIYGVTTQGVLSGEALKQLEIGLIGKCERFQKDNTDAIRTLITLTAEIQNTFKAFAGIELAEVPAVIVVSMTWKPAELLDSNAQITILIAMRKEAPGLWDDDFYRGKIGGLLGMSQQDIEKESLKAKQTNQNLFETLVGAGGVTSPVV